MGFSDVPCRTLVPVIQNYTVESNAMHKFKLYVHIENVYCTMIVSSPEAIMFSFPNRFLLLLLLLLIRESVNKLGIFVTYA